MTDPVAEAKRPLTPMKIDTNTVSQLKLSLTWADDGVTHREDYFVPKVNMWRDILPPEMAEQVLGRTVGEKISVELAAGRVVPNWDEKNLLTIAAHQFASQDPAVVVPPQRGRFYPGSMLHGVPGFFPQTTTPVRVIGLEGQKIRIDCNHPLATFPLLVNAEVLEVLPHEKERGGSCSAWLEEAASNGPGMQTGRPGYETDFSCPDAAKREDEGRDYLFYQRSRLVDHIDLAAQKVLADYHVSKLGQGLRILDLMSSKTTHLPANHEATITGLGLNETELAANPLLAGYVIHDLNEEPLLPFAVSSFDAVLCSLSFEYLLAPRLLLAEIARVLSPGGTLIISFSNRWFPEKVTRLWTRLHDFERLGLVLKQCQTSGKFTDLETFSSRNWPRPSEDRYAASLFIADPIFAVTAHLPA